MNTDDWFATALIVAVGAYLTYDAIRGLRKHRARIRFQREADTAFKKLDAYRSGQVAAYDVLTEWLDLQAMTPAARDAYHRFRAELADDRLIAQWTARMRAEDEKRKGGDQS